MGQLDDFKDLTVELARRTWEQSGHICGINVFALVSDGQVMVINCAPSSSPGVKDALAATVGAVLKRVDAIACVVMMESWYTLNPQALPDGSYTPPSESENRQECIFLAYESKSCQAQMILHISRDQDGAHLHDGKWVPCEAQGRFAGFLRE